MKKSELRQLIKEAIKEKSIAKINLNKLKENFEEDENIVRSFYFSKSNASLDNKEKIKNEANHILQNLKKDNFIISTSGFLYFPNFTWAGGKQIFGRSIGFLVGSDTWVIRFMETNKSMKVNDSLLSRLIKSNILEAYKFKF